MIRIVLNEALMKLRKRHAELEESLDSNLAGDGDAIPRDVADWSPNPQELYDAVEFREILIKCLLALQPALRVVFVLRDIEELSISEISEVLSLSEVAVKARLFRARLQLKDRLSRYFKKRDGYSSAFELSRKPKFWRTQMRMSSVQIVLGRQGARST
jgi:RNA polymerase sigma-70 factor (ECF subfamily)